jgi:pimeloyl-ACP methyl ester carboxylesterase
VATAITMPRLGLSMVEGTVLEWRARPGDVVRAGDVLLVIESEKAECEVEAFAAGVIAAVYAEPGTTLPSGALLGALAAPGEAFDAGAFADAFVATLPGAPATAARPVVATAAGARARPVSAEAPSAAAATKAAPAARARARALGVDLANVTGSGPGGRIMPEDVERAARALVHVEGAALACACEGEGPPVLLIGGLGVDARAWRRQRDDLRRDATVVTYDQRGVGRSSRLVPSDALTIGRLADDAAAVLRHVAAVPAVVVGASLGAAVALELALRHPGVARALVLLTPVFIPDARLEAVLRSWCAEDRPDPEPRVRAMLPWLLGRPLLADAGKREAFAATLRAMTPQVPAASLRGHAEALLAWLGTRTGRLADVTVPVLVVAGADDVLAPPAHAEALARALPNARLETLADAGHALMIERAELVNGLIRDVIAASGTERALP